MGCLQPINMNFMDRMLKQTKMNKASNLPEGADSLDAATESASARPGVNLSSGQQSSPDLTTMEVCEAVERELDKVTSKFGGVSEESAARIDEQIAYINELKATLLLRGDEELNYTDVKYEQSYVLAELLRIREPQLWEKQFGNFLQNFTPDFGSITRDGIFSGERDKILTQVICQHLYRQGLLDIGDNLCVESGLCLDPKYKEPFVELHRILEALKLHNLEPALKWAGENRQALLQQGSSLEFKLHRLAFLNLLKEGPTQQSQAITYARTNFTQFVKRHEKEIQVLMGALVFISGGIESSPYSHLFDNNLWEDIQDTFTRDACARLGLSVDSPFSAGCVALPALLNICQVMQARQVANIWSGKDELPIEIDLGKDFHYHSVFACPILRQQASESNPPMRLTCGHVISRDALHKLASGNKLKCPYCPGEQNPNEARQITF
ncbi:Protein RMD5 A [Orchesella cincta]|uniref:Protein RMD5 A n=1 Tax=Orchesella cincta TaxID=48709 RepID=A0A1D2MZD8_ORCCI|nr:Protein RMD5 A [Orchesella cincta]